MEEQFVPYELALKLKELGFKDECLRTYDEDGNFCTKITQRLYCKAPLWQQAFDWFRDDYHMFVDIIHFTKQPVNGEIWTDVFQFFINGGAFLCYFKTYEEARLECLKKLIEIVSNENI